MYAISPPGHEAILPVNLTYIHKVVEYALLNMNNPQNPTTHPEIGPINSVGQVTRGPVVTTGEIVFNKAPLLPVGPRAVIQRAIDSQNGPGQETMFSEATGKPLQK